MVSSKNALELLQEMLDRAHGSQASRLRLQSWDRIIKWKIDGEEFFWVVEEGSLNLSSPQKPDFTLACSLKVLERLASGQLPLFIAMWGTNDVEFTGSFADAFHLGYVFLSDNRSHQVVFIAHCFLNTNTRFPGGSAFKGATVPLIELLLKSGLGIVQMPCPEFQCLGLEKELYGAVSEVELRKCFRELAQGVVDQIKAYQNLGYEIAGVIGMNPSPSCGVEITKGKGTMLGVDRDLSEKPGSGVFIEELQKLVLESGLTGVPIFGFRRILPGEAGLDERISELGEKLNC